MHAAQASPAPDDAAGAEHKTPLLEHKRQELRSAAAAESGSPTQTLRRLGATLQRSCRADRAPDVLACLDALEQLSRMDVTPDLLKESGIGQTVKKLSCFRKEPTIAERSQAIVKRWEALVCQEARGAAPEPAHPTAMVAEPDATACAAADLAVAPTTHEAAGAASVIAPAASEP